MNRTITSDHVIAKEVGTIDCKDELRPTMRTGRLEGDVDGEVPDDPGRGVETPPADLGDAFLLTGRDNPVLAPDPEEPTVEVIMVRKPGLLHLASDGDKEVAAGAV